MGRPTKGGEWQDWEITVLKEMYPKHDIIFDEVCEKLPHRSPNSIRCKAVRLGLRRPLVFSLTHAPTEEEIALYAV